MGKILNNCLYITSGIVLSEIIYKACRMFYKVLMENYLLKSNHYNCVDLVLFSGNSIDCKCNPSTNIIKTNCFNNYCGNKNLQIFIKLIDLSKKSIYLCVFLITCNEIGNALIRANKRGVIIFIITDNGGANNPASQIHRFFKEDIPITFQSSEQSNIMHHKFCLFDVDWIDGDNDDVYVGDAKPHVVRDSYKNKMGDVGLLSDNVPVDNIPSDSCAKSDKFNKIMSNYPNHFKSDLRKSVFEKKKCAVNIVNPLDSVFIPKGGLLLTGSLNWTAQAFYNNYENVLITSNNYMINEYQKEFQRLWKYLIKI